MIGRRLLALIETAAVIGALTSCGVSVGAPEDAERQALATKKASVVLLRLLATHDGQPVNFLGNVDVLNVLTSGGYILLVENVETGDQIKLARPRTPSAEAERDGWIYLVLGPGRYHVIVRPWPLGEISRPFLLSVPSTPAVVYAGSLPIACGKPGLHQGPNLTRSSFPRAC
jgi:hypothetical protein